MSRDKMARDLLSNRNRRGNQGSGNKGFGSFISFSLHPKFVQRDAKLVRVSVPIRFGLPVQAEIGTSDSCRPTRSDLAGIGVKGEPDSRQHRVGAGMTVPT